MAFYHEEGYGYIATFADPDGNYFQLVQIRAKNNLGIIRTVIAVKYLT